MLRLHTFAQRAFSAAFVAQEVTPIVEKCLRFDLEMDSNTTVIGPALDAGARVATQAGRIQLRLGSVGRTTVVRGESQLQHKSVKWNKTPSNCRRTDEKIGRAHV